MSYVNKVKKDANEYDIHDARLEVSSEDVGKLVGVDAEGHLALVDAPSGGTKLYLHKYFIGPTVFNVISTKSSKLTSDDRDLVLSGNGSILVESVPTNGVLTGLSGGGGQTVIYVLTADGEQIVDITSIEPTITEL